VVPPASPGLEVQYLPIPISGPIWLESLAPDAQAQSQLTEGIPT